MTANRVLGPSYSGTERRVVAGAATAAAVEAMISAATQKAVEEILICKILE
jgi:hypothetical protein